MKVLIIVEESGTGSSAYAPDLPGRSPSTGPSEQEKVRLAL